MPSGASAASSSPSAQHSAGVHHQAFVAGPSVRGASKYQNDT
eukprot:CAMPEP_0180520572 /NCGR_PEP_ID=MMETSP1036_2-20121128/56337_1 /TAXON_ID=632150 /ORGANISM="Azadinium spinosum, Strain 3D9" /LENGTH=41 /DNA_ID= /DNA_START= /DNA_END= /DNA_ORIENTATION=